MPVPLTARLTVWFPETALEAEAVTVITVVANSEPELVLTDKFTVGVDGRSLSFIIIFCVVVAPNAIPEDGLLMVSVAVSLPSISASSSIEKVTEPVVCPSKMVIVLLLNV